jgi:hypothetical protein
MPNTLRRAIAVPLAVLGASFAYAFYDRYWRWRDCFNDLGRCYDPISQDVFLEQSGMIWGGLAVLCFGLAALLAFRRR